VVIAAKLDRLFRSELDALEVQAQFIKRDIGLHLINLGGDIANGLSKRFYTIAVAFAEAERDRIREHVLSTKADQKNRGRFLGGTAPFGWLVSEDGALIAVPEQQGGNPNNSRITASGHVAEGHSRQGRWCRVPRHRQKHCFASSTRCVFSVKA